MIESVNNEKIKNYAKLNNKKYRDETNLFIIEGEHLVKIAKDLNLLVDAFSLDGSIGTKVSLSVMKKLSSLDNPSNVLGIAKKLDNNKITGNILILDDIQNPGNLGTIIRSAVAFNIDTVVASLNTVDLYNPKVIRATEGMLFNLNYVVKDLNGFLSELKDYRILTTDVLGGTNLCDIKIDGKYAIIIGNEGSGVKKELSSYANEKIYIPMNEKCESLNVGVATSIILYELNKTR